MSDPAVWFASCAKLDGVDPFSSSPVDVLTFAVYKKRQLISALQTRAMLTVMSGSDQAEVAVKAYFEAVMPMGDAVQQVHNLAAAASPTWGTNNKLPVGVGAVADKAKYSSFGH